MPKRLRIEPESNDICFEPKHANYSDSRDRCYSDSENDLDSISGSDFESDSASESDADIDIETYTKSFSFKLRKWAVTYNISLMALTFLLKILIEEGFTYLPKDARTLLGTPRSVNVTKIGEGFYWYRSLKEKLVKICKKRKCPSLLELGIHMDGFPPFNGSKLEFWPIQCWIKGLKMKPFFVGLHLGASKPTSLESFLRPLLNDLHDLIENGLEIKVNGTITNFMVKVYQMILDAPARAFVKCIIGHSGYFSCEKCEEEGVYLVRPEKQNDGENPSKKRKQNPKQKGHVCLIGTDAPLRTDGSFRSQSQEEHHHGDNNLRLIQ